MSSTTRNSSSTTGTDHVRQDGPSPRELGIGARASVHPHCDDFVAVVLGALDDVERAGLGSGLVRETDDVSTWVGAVDPPAEERLARYVAGLVEAAWRRSGEGHVVTHLLLSRGCPGEVSCDLAVTGLPAVAPVRLEPTGIRAAAQWSLYPLADDDRSHMALIEAAIARARQRGVALEPRHYATMLRGDLADVLATAVDAWSAVGREVAHVVAHLTVSVGSPSPEAPATGSRS